ncbi:MAG TPA: plastocyanin/azurin family copper-binding protein [Gemmatimonadaceae bacterium]|nr:plastocyanin/azurin family copper-binding protein [Gemmatimonadaceae bacterium]
MRFRLMLALVTAAACGGGGGSDGGPTTPIIPTTPNNPVATTAVSLQSNAFNPADIVVAPSAVVTFTNSDNIAHNVTFANQNIASVGNWNSGDRTVAMPAAAGTYSYTCTIHAGMNGTVKVQ